jgi:hypothetical protein
MYSGDGLAWTGQLPGIPKSAISVVYDNGYFIAMNESGTAMTSVDGITWDSTSAANNPFKIDSRDGNCNAVTAGNGTLVSVEGRCYRNIY